MIYRTYFSKDATTYSGSELNSGGNPILKLIRGGGVNYAEHSRIFFDINIEKIFDKIKNNEIPNGFYDGNTFSRKHIIRLYNTMYYDRDSLGRSNSTPTNLPSSYKLNLYLVKQEWHEGRGYDYLNINGSNKLTSNEGVTYRNSKTNIVWGAFNDIFEKISDVEIDVGNENVEIDVTELIEIMLKEKNDNNGGNDSYINKYKGFMLKFDNEISNRLQTLELFGKDTHTFFEPYMETIWDYNTYDNRYKIPSTGINKLYFYPSLNGKMVNVDTNSIEVEIYNGDDELILTQNNGIKHESLGVYSIMIDMYDLGNEINTYVDKWKFKYDGREYVVSDYFETIDESFIFNSIYSEPIEYGFNITGIRQNEKIKDNEKRKLIIKLKDAYNDEVILPHKVSFDLYMKLGNTKVFLFNNEILNKDKDDFYYTFIDFTWFIAQDYCIDINIECNGEIRNYEKLEFSVIDSKLINKINGL